MAPKVHHPTPEQLINRRLLAQEVRTLVNEGQVTPSQDAYMYTPPMEPGENVQRPCLVCAVGSVVVAAAVSKYPNLMPKVGVHRLTGSIGRYDDYHTSLAALVGFTFTEVVAFEAAFMGAVVVPPAGVVEHMWNKGYLDIDIPKPAPNFSQWRLEVWDSVEAVDLVRDALKWWNRQNAGDTTVLLRLMDLMESWADNPVSFPLTKKGEG